MSESQNVAQVRVIQATKLSDFEERLNGFLVTIPEEALLGIEYLYDHQTYGIMAMVRYVVTTTEG